MLLSLAMIVRDNESVLAQTLESVKGIVDEIVIVDTGSTDGTKAVAEKYGAVIYDFLWIDDFSAARNFSFEKTKGDWIMWLDSGDVIPPETLDNWKVIRKVIADPKNTFEGLMIRMNRLIDSRGDILQWYYICRIARRTANPIWVEPIHETIATDTNNFTLVEGAYVNDPLAFHQGISDRNLNILLRLKEKGDVSARTHYYLGQELLAHGRVDEADAEFRALLDTKDFTYQRYVSLLNLARIARAKDEMGRFVNWVQQAIFFDPTKPDAFVWLGDLFFDQENWLKAMPFYRAVIGMEIVRDGAPTQEPYYAYYPWGKLGFCYLNLNNVKEAIRCFREAERTSAGPIKDNYKKFIKDLTINRKNTK